MRVEALGPGEDALRTNCGRAIIAIRDLKELTRLERVSECSTRTITSGKWCAHNPWLDYLERSITAKAPNSGIVNSVALLSLDQSAGLASPIPNTRRSPLVYVPLTRTRKPRTGRFE